MIDVDSQRWRTRAVWALAVLALLFGLRHVYSGWRLGASRDLGVNGDISVYIGAINFLRDGGALYDYPIGGGYGFTYPPFAAIVLRPLTWATPSTTGLVWLSLCVLVAVTIAALVVSTRRWLQGRPGRLLVLGLATGAFLGSVQVQSDLITGQVNLVLALLVILDVGRFVPDRFRGALVGVAAAVKLTPLVIWGWFLLTRQWRALANSVAAFVACTVLAIAVLPSASRHYWTSAIFDTGRVGDVELRFNASVMGTLARAGVDGSARTFLWLAIGGIVVLAAFWNAERARQVGDHVAAAVLLGCAAVVATPIAWPHHQVWLPLAGIVLALREAWLPRVVGLVVLAFAYLHVPVIQWSDARGLGAVFGNADFAMLVGVCVLGLGGSARPRRDVGNVSEEVRGAARPRT